MGHWHHLILESHCELDEPCKHVGAECIGCEQSIGYADAYLPAFVDLGLAKVLTQAALDRQQAAEDDELDVDYKPLYRVGCTGEPMREIAPDAWLEGAYEERTEIEIPPRDELSGDTMP